MSQSPGPLTASRIALMPDGSVAEVVLDSAGKAFGRWNGGSWSNWYPVAASIVDISIAASQVSSSDTAVCSATFSDGSRGFYLLTPSGITVADL